MMITVFLVSKKFDKKINWASYIKLKRKEKGKCGTRVENTSLTTSHACLEKEKLLCL